MQDLLTHYSVSEILIFIVMLAVAFKAVVSFWDWAQDWLGKKFNIKFKKERDQKNLESKMTELQKITMDQETRINKIGDALKLLIESDKDNIKSWIVEKHHHFCYEIKAIDYFSLESIERRYDHYCAESGNSYIATLMEEIKALPKIETAELLETEKKFQQMQQNKK